MLYFKSHTFSHFLTLPHTFSHFLTLSHTFWHAWELWPRTSTLPRAHDMSTHTPGSLVLGTYLFCTRRSISLVENATVRRRLEIIWKYQAFAS